MPTASQVLLKWLATILGCPDAAIHRIIDKVFSRKFRRASLRGHDARPPFLYGTGRLRFRMGEISKVFGYVVELEAARSSRVCRMETRGRSTRDEKADREHLLDPRRGHAGPGRTWRGRQRRVRTRWLVGELLGRSDGSGHGRGGEHAVRPRSRTQDLRHLRRVLAARLGGGWRQAIERRHQVRRV